MTVKQGKNGRVTAYSEIALDFHLWLDPAMRVTMMRISNGQLKNPVLQDRLKLTKRVIVRDR